jgi:hypothetical protein
MFLVNVKNCTLRCFVMCINAFKKSVWRICDFSDVKYFAFSRNPLGLASSEKSL